MDFTMLGLCRLLFDAFHVLATLLLLGKQQNCANWGLDLIYVGAHSLGHETVVKPLWKSHKEIKVTLDNSAVASISAVAELLDLLRDQM